MFDPLQPTLKQRIASGECLAVSWLAFGSVAVADAAARARPDAVVIDMQHGLWDRHTLEAAIGAIPPRVPVIVRVAENSALAIGTALDAGAEGVMVPMVETAAQAREAVASAFYPPVGRRSGGGVRPLQNFPDYVQGASHVAVIPMIETAAGLANAEAIAKVQGLDMVFVGSGDLALSLQTWGGDPLKHVQACARIKRACDAAGLPCGMFTGTLKAAQEHHALGYLMVVVANDLDVVAQGFASANEAFRKAAAAAPARSIRKPAAKPVRKSAAAR